MNQHSYGWDYASDVCVAGSYAYLAGLNLLVLDISNPANPVHVGQYIAEGADVWRVRIHGTNAYVAADFGFENGLGILNLSSPTNPVLAAMIEVEDEAHDIAFAGDRAFFAAGYDGLQIVDVSDPSHPVVEAAGESLNVHSVWVEGHHAYVETGTELAILDVGDPIQQRRAGGYPGGALLEVAGRRGFVRVGGWSGGNYTNAIDIVDMSNPTNLVRLGSIATDLQVHRLQVIGNRAYVSQFSYQPPNLFGFEVVDISAPENPVQLSRFMTNGNIRALEVSGHYAFAADTTNTLRVLDISNPAALTTVAIYNSNGPPFCVDCRVGATSLALVSNVVYVAAGNGMHIVDVNDPLNPRGIYAFFAQVHIYGMQARHGYVGYRALAPSWVGGPPGGGVLLLQDVSNPKSPAPAGGIGTGDGGSFDVLGGYVYYCGDDQLRIYEMQKPGSIRVSRSDGNNLHLGWNGATGMHLESAPSPDVGWGMWTEVPGSDGKSSVTVPMNSGPEFFRVAQP